MSRPVRVQLVVETLSWMRQTIKWMRAVTLGGNETTLIKMRFLVDQSGYQFMMIYKISPKKKRPVWWWKKKGYIFTARKYSEFNSFIRGKEQMAVRGFCHGSLDSESLPSSYVRSRFLPCLWVDICLKEWLAMNSGRQWVQQHSHGKAKLCEFEAASHSWIKGIPAMWPHLRLWSSGTQQRFI